MNNSFFATPNPSKGEESTQDEEKSPLSNNLVQIGLFLRDGKPYDDFIPIPSDKVIWAEILDHKIADLKAVDLKIFPKRCLRIN
jgi:hypothetical protein